MKSSAAGEPAAARGLVRGSGLLLAALAAGGMLTVTEYLLFSLLDYRLPTVIWGGGLAVAAGILLVEFLILAGGRLPALTREWAAGALPVLLAVYQIYLSLGWYGPRTLAAGALLIGIVFLGAGVLAARLRAWTEAGPFAPALASVGVTGVAVAVQQIALRFPSGFSPQRQTLLMLAGAVGWLMIAMPCARWHRGRPAAGLLLLIVFGGGGCLLRADPSFEMQALPNTLPAEVRASIPAAPPGTLPDIIMISLDTVRAASCSVYGYPRPTTPFLTAWANSRATVYTRAIAPSTWTLASHTSIFSGRYPSEHRVDWSFDPGGNPALAPVPDAEHLLAEYLQLRGYHTTGLAANYVYFSREWNITRGFDRFQCPPQTMCSISSVAAAAALILFPELKDRFQLYRDAGRLTDDAVALLDQPGAKPLFLFVNYMDAHDPTWPPEAYRREFIPDAPARRPHRPLKDFSPEQQRLFLGLYDASIRYLDDQLARLLHHPRARNAMIIIFGDHGELFGEHDLIGHGTIPYHNVAWVPLIIRSPGQERPDLVKEPTSLVTIPHLIAAAVGLTFPLPAGPRPAVAQSFNVPDTGTISYGWYEGPWKSLYRSPDRYELFQIETDPEELRDCRATAPSVAARLQAALDATLVPLPPPVGELDEQLKRRLRGLGYLH